MMKVPFSRVPILGSTAYLKRKLESYFLNTSQQCCDHEKVRQTKSDKHEGFHETTHRDLDSSNENDSNTRVRNAAQGLELWCP